jgi:hypothetical protein
MNQQEQEQTLIDVPLVPDPDADEELGPGDAKAIADEDLKGTRLLIVRRAIEPIHINGTPGGMVTLVSTFQPAPHTRFIWARLLIRLTSPQRAKIVDLAPREVRENEPVRFTINDKGKLGIEYKMAKAGVESGVQKEFSSYHCTVQGSGESTAVARWDFKENPHRKDGLGSEQILVLTLPVTGIVTATVSLSARLAHPGLRGSIETLRDLILGPDVRHYPIGFKISDAKG